MYVPIPTPLAICFLLGVFVWGLHHRGLRSISAWLVLGVALLLGYDMQRERPADDTLFAIVFWSYTLIAALAWALAEIRERIEDS